MTERILLLASHAVAEYDDLRMFTDLGYDVFAPGGYEVPSRSGEGIRPPLPDAPHHPEFVEMCHQTRVEKGEPGRAIDWAKAHIPDAIIDWADAIIVHHFPEVWIGEQWERIKHKRVIWRTCGQSDPRLEREMGHYVMKGLQVVRYSPKEKEAFLKVGAFAGEDAVIRFGKYPDDYGPYEGDWPVIGNLTQDMLQRGDSTGLWAWQQFTKDLPNRPAGKGSEPMGGLGELAYEDMLEYLRRVRVYLYTGTIPASYTLGLIEVMLSGTPVVASGLRADGTEWSWIRDIDEADDITRLPWLIHELKPHPSRIRYYLDYPEIAKRDGEAQRQRAVDLFDVATIGQQWREFLS